MSTAPKKLLQDNLILFKNDGEKFAIEAEEDSIVLFISGETLLRTNCSTRPVRDEHPHRDYQAFEDVGTASSDPPGGVKSHDSALLMYIYKQILTDDKNLLIDRYGGFIGSIARYLVSQLNLTVSFHSIPVGNPNSQYCRKFLIGFLTGIAEKSMILTPSGDCS